MDAEQCAMQQQIVNMYIRSIQQFTESLAKMKLPMELDQHDSEDCSDMIQNHNNNKSNIDQIKKKLKRMDNVCHQREARLHNRRRMILVFFLGF